MKLVSRKNDSKEIMSLLLFSITFALSNIMDLPYHLINQYITAARALSEFRNRMLIDLFFGRRDIWHEHSLYVERRLRLHV